MPLATLQLAENNISVAHAVELVGALRAGAPSLRELDLSGNPVCGVEEGGKDEFSTELVEALCAWVQEEGTALTSLSLVDVALCGLARDGNGSYQSQAISLLVELLGSGHGPLRSLTITGCRVQEDEALDLGKALSKNDTLERLLADRTPLAVQQLLCGERLNLNGLDFSEVDASLMAQLLVHNATLTCADLGGAKPLAREIKILSDSFARCRFQLQELSVAGRLLGLEGAASLLDALKECPLQVLDLTGNEICGVRSSGTEPFNPYVVRLVCGLIRREGGGLRRLRLKGNNLIGNDVYTNEAVLLISEALRSPHCLLEELHLGLTNKGAGLREEDGLLLGKLLNPNPNPSPGPSPSPNPNPNPTLPLTRRRRAEVRQSRPAECDAR